ncbi:uncharacterized protein SOCEGT47_082640 [Sorangium cellulosum]|uniref:HEPN domain-containing protein n=1 Tax=Sorangium cellulosum TaxID=56 RepID=A0A4P2QE33_SORCE|nr:hypothetical protein [Sorangium cellulosum]AUX27666.1 uncharacterized protein SOCEGT47_082640 [Sorangium cellulosum]
MRVPGQLSKRQSALLSAALRHIRDAEHLLAPEQPHTSPDQAYHLAGFGPECARKATLTNRWSDKPLGHTMGRPADPLLEFALALDPTAARYNPLDWGTRYPALSTWDPQCRYEATGTRTWQEVELLLGEASRAVQEIVAALWADGRLPDGSFEARRAP